MSVVATEAQARAFFAMLDVCDLPALSEALYRRAERGELVGFAAATSYANGAFGWQVEVGDGAPSDLLAALKLAQDELSEAIRYGCDPTSKDGSEGPPAAPTPAAPASDPGAMN